MGPLVFVLKLGIGLFGLGEPDDARAFVPGKEALECRFALGWFEIHSCPHIERRPQEGIVIGDFPSNNHEFWRATRFPAIAQVRGESLNVSLAGSNEAHQNNGLPVLVVSSTGRADVFGFSPARSSTQGSRPGFNPERHESKYGRGVPDVRNLGLNGDWFAFNQSRNQDFPDSQSRAVGQAKFLPGEFYRVSGGGGGIDGAPRGGVGSPGGNSRGGQSGGDKHRANDTDAGLQVRDVCGVSSCVGRTDRLLNAGVVVALCCLFVLAVAGLCWGLIGDGRSRQ